MTENNYLNYWNSLYDKQNYFGTGPTKLALFAESLIKSKNIKKILDVGCGQGRDTFYFSHLGYDVHSIDISNNAIGFVNRTKELLKLNSINAKVHDIEQPFDYPVESFDFIYSNLALQFFEEAKLNNIFMNISKILKSNSSFLFSTKKEGDKYYQFGQKINEFAFEYKGITRYFYPQETIKKLLSNYFEILYFDSESHTNPDSTVSVWWKILVQKPK